MNRLRGMTCYLCGPMDRVPDGGAGWRQLMSDRLREFEVGVFNPCDKPSDFAQEDEDSRTRILHMKEWHDFEGLERAMKPICSVDLRMVDIAHFLIMNIDIDVHLCGSYHEAFLAISQKKPVLIRCRQGKQNLPNWMFGVVPHEMVFSKWDELVDYLKYVDSHPEVEDHNRWRFFDFDKVYGKQKAINAQE